MAYGLGTQHEPITIDIDDERNIDKQPVQRRRLAMLPSGDRYRPSYQNYDPRRIVTPSPERYIPRRPETPYEGRLYDNDRHYEPTYNRSLSERIQPDLYRPDQPERLRGEDPGLRLLRRMDLSPRDHNFEPRGRELSPRQPYARPRADTWRPPPSCSPSRSPVRSPIRGRMRLRDSPPPPPRMALKRKRTISPSPPRTPLRMRVPPPPLLRSRSRSPPRHPPPRRLQDRISPAKVLVRRIDMSASPERDERFSGGRAAQPDKRRRVERSNSRTRGPRLQDDLVNVNVASRPVAAWKPGMPAAEAILGWSAKHIQESSGSSNLSSRLSEMGARTREASPIPARPTAQDSDMTDGQKCSQSQPENVLPSVQSLPQSQPPDQPPEPPTAPPPLPKINQQDHVCAPKDPEQNTSTSTAAIIRAPLIPSTSDSPIDSNPEAKTNYTQGVGAKKVLERPADTMAVDVLKANPEQPASSSQNVQPNDEIKKLNSQADITHPPLQQASSSSSLESVERLVEVKKPDNIHKSQPTTSPTTATCSVAATEKAGQQSQSNKGIVGKPIPSRPSARGTNHVAAQNMINRRPSFHQQTGPTMAMGGVFNPQQQSAYYDQEDSIADMCLPGAFPMFGEMLPEMMAVQFMEHMFFPQEPMLGAPFMPTPMGMPLPVPQAMPVPFFGPSNIPPFMGGLPPQFPQLSFETPFNQSFEQPFKQPLEQQQQHIHYNDVEQQQEQTDEVSTDPSKQVQEFLQQASAVMGGGVAVSTKGLSKKERRKLVEKQKQIGLDLSDYPRSRRGRFSLACPSNNDTHPGQPFIFDPARMLVMENIPLARCNLTFVRTWRRKVDTSELRVIVDPIKKKALIEFSSVEAAQKAFDGPRFEQTKTQGVRVWFWRPDSQEGDIDREAGEAISSQETKEVMPADGEEPPRAGDFQPVSDVNQDAPKESQTSIQVQDPLPAPSPSSSNFLSASTSNTRIEASLSTNTMDISIASSMSMLNDVTLGGYASSSSSGSLSAQTTPTDSTAPLTPSDSPPNFKEMADALISEVICSVTGQPLPSKANPILTPTMTHPLPPRPTTRPSSSMSTASSTNTPKSTTQLLLSKQQRLEQHIAESKQLMSRLSAATSKSEKDRILVLLREKNRSFDDAIKTPQRPKLTKRPSIFKTPGMRWPETSRHNVSFVLSDSESECEGDDEFDS